MKKIAVIDPGMGNLRSVCKAWEHAGAEVTLVAEPSAVGGPDGVVFPGQGAITDCMAALRATGFDDLIRSWIAEDRPFFGICLGLQALFEHSEEGDVPALGIFPGEVKRFRLPVGMKVPHMGWNSVDFKKEPSVMLEGLRPSGDQFYFVHSYYVTTPADEIVWCTAEYGHPFAAGIRRGNCFATQFHPEKSQAKGLQIYRNFLQMPVTAA